MNMPNAGEDADEGGGPMSSGKGECCGTTNGQLIRKPNPLVTIKGNGEAPRGSEKR